VSIVVNVNDKLSIAKWLREGGLMTGNKKPTVKRVGFDLNG